MKKKMKKKMTMKTYTITFNCRWDPTLYPVEYTYGEFPFSAENDFKVIFYIKKHFLDHPALLGYHFIISGNDEVFEMKCGA